ncbi:hypothetical protein [Myxococcus sp. RHSTA-1-4]|uniref:hypothetical protein n=1 Tax=Myxococcus sp. RHSTA-1-4 TaxID=2874601 RepID=UPI001CBBAAAB|nr:hypothetical protein [Myxococcus sp. RHSTA-1-4]MBZ4419170.1 hypothetical protein [Myxococcus sp. RHSTA-1-4]
MAEREVPKKDPRLPEDEAPLKREAGDRPIPTPGHIGHLPDDSPGPGKPVVYPPHEPEE